MPWKVTGCWLGYGERESNDWFVYKSIFPAVHHPVLSTLHLPSFTTSLNHPLRQLHLKLPFILPLLAQALLPYPWRRQSRLRGFPHQYRLIAATRKVVCEPYTNTSCEGDDSSSKVTS